MCIPIDYREDFLVGFFDVLIVYYWFISAIPIVSSNNIWFLAPACDAIVMFNTSTSISVMGFDFGVIVYVIRRGLLPRPKKRSGFSPIAANTLLIISSIGFVSVLPILRFFASLILAYAMVCLIAVLQCLAWC